MGSGGAPSTGGTIGTGGATGTGGTTGTGGISATGGATGVGGRGDGSDAGSDVRPRLDSAGAGGGNATDAARETGPEAQPDLVLDLRTIVRDGGNDVAIGGGSDATTHDGAPCPFAGHVSYTLVKAANPSTDQQSAYAAIAAAMDEAVYYYNCYTNITKVLSVSYDASVETADGNVNGSIRFGSGRAYMVPRVCMHEIAHTAGVGQYASPNWLSFVNIPSGGSNGPWTGTHATAELRAITGKATDTLTADHDHFWPYGLNKDTDPHAEPDLIAHCRIVMALRQDLGIQ